jgi:hypothetical protein
MAKMGVSEEPSKTLFFEKYPNFMSKYCKNEDPTRS